MIDDHAAAQGRHTFWLLCVIAISYTGARVGDGAPIPLKGSAGNGGMQRYPSKTQRRGRLRIRSGYRYGSDGVEPANETVRFFQGVALRMVTDPAGRITFSVSSRRTPEIREAATRAEANKLFDEELASCGIAWPAWWPQGS
jgi:hypothetical protein